MLNVPIYISLVFGLTTLLALSLFYAAAKGSKWTFGLIAAWLTLQSAVALSGFYTKTDVMPPRCAWLFWPPVLLIGALFCTKPGRHYLDQLDLRFLTVLHSVRLLTSLIFYWLFVNRAVPQLLTTSGRNPDMFAGLTAPLVCYFGFVRKSISHRIIWIWNLVGLGLLLNLVVNAILSGPFPFQQFAFDQPDVAFLYFPFVWMPCCLVPLLLFSHLVALRQLPRLGRIK